MGAKGDTGSPGAQGADGADGADGLACWDLNGNGNCETASEAADISGTCAIQDCRAETVCYPGDNVVCYSGPPGTLGVGMCNEGVRYCNAAGTGFEATCTGEVVPQAEVVNTPGDEDCDGILDYSGHMVFVTSQSYFGNMGFPDNPTGLAGADAICASHASAGTFTSSLATT